VQPTERAVVPIGVALRGRVIYSDGSPVPGARVLATTSCERDWAHFVDDALTADDGTFVIPSFDSSCGQIRFTAEKRDGFWLQTGIDPFYPRPNGTTPEVLLADNEPPDPITIQLDLRGGELELRVWDQSSGGYVRAGLDVDCPGAWCGAMSTATGEDGAAHIVFLPPRRYRVSLNWYLCGPKPYFPENKPSLTVDVVEGQMRTAVLRLDVTTIPAKPSYDNPDGVPCRL